MNLPSGITGVCELAEVARAPRKIGRNGAKRSVEPGARQLPPTRMMRARVIRRRVISETDDGIMIAQNLDA